MKPPRLLFDDETALYAVVWYDEDATRRRRTFRTKKDARHFLDSLLPLSPVDGDAVPSPDAVETPSPFGSLAPDPRTVRGLVVWILAALFFFPCVLSPFLILLRNLIATP